MLLPLAACDKILPLIAKVGNVAEIVSKWIGLLKGAMPALDLSADTEQTALEVIGAAEDALDALEAVGKTAESTTDADYVAAKEELQKAYDALIKFAEKTGMATAAAEVAAGPDSGERVGTQAELAELLEE